MGQVENRAWRQSGDQIAYQVGDQVEHWACDQIEPQVEGQVWSQIYDHLKEDQDETS